MNQSELHSYRRAILQLGGIGSVALALWACAPEISNAVATTNIETSTNIPTETPTTTPEPTPSPTPEIPQPGEVWIEQMGEVEPLDIKMTTEFTIEYEKMPKITWENVSSGRLRETLLQKWESEGKLTTKYIAENGIYAAKPSDWVESPYHFIDTIIGSYLNVYDAENLLVPPNFNYLQRPIRSNPEVFELIGEDGMREAMIATTMVVFERPDKTLGIEPWFYYLDQEVVGLRGDGFEAECLGHELSNSQMVGNRYPVSIITLDPELFTPYRRSVDWNETGRYEAQGELLRRVINDGYPSPDLGKEFLTFACILMK